MDFDDLHANCDRRAEKMAPNTKPVGPHAPNAENTMLRFRPTGKVLIVPRSVAATPKSLPMMKSGATDWPRAREHSAWPLQASRAQVVELRGQSSQREVRG
ncbi:hypothetical protein KCV07_g116, partial [Aureobasidium melanogenum]